MALHRLLLQHPRSQEQDFSLLPRVRPVTNSVIQVKSVEFPNCTSDIP